MTNKAQRPPEFHGGHNAPQSPIQEQRDRLAVEEMLRKSKINSIINGMIEAVLIAAAALGFITFLVLEFLCLLGKC
jgi:hypothetical protein